MMEKSNTQDKKVKVVKTQVNGENSNLTTGLKFNQMEKIL